MFNARALTVESRLSNPILRKARMENTSNVFADAGQHTYWPMARAANADLLLMSMPRVNLLLTGTETVIQDALKTLMPVLGGPVHVWTAREPMELPPPTQPGTLILRDVGSLSRADQYRLIKWLDRSAGRTQVISTTNSSLWELVEIGVFHATLYYRLNVTCVDLTA
jgi:hypothetical protein